MRLETVFRPDADVEHFSLAYPTGDPPVAVTLDTRCTTHAALAAHIADSFDAAIGLSRFTCTVDADDGHFSLESSGKKFDLDVHSAMQAFLSWDASYVDISDFDGDAYPPSQFRAAAPLERPHPRWLLDRSGVESDHGRVEGVCRGMLPYQPMRVVFDSSDWDGLVEWLTRYGLRGVAFSVFRSTDSGLYCLTDSGAINADGRSVCVIEAGAEMSRAWLTGRARVRGYIDIEPRIIEGV